MKEGKWQEENERQMNQDKSWKEREREEPRKIIKREKSTEMIERQIKINYKEKNKWLANQDR